MYTEENTDQIVSQMQKILGFSEGSKKQYKNNLGLYAKFHGMSLEELLEEAEDDEDNNVRKRKRRVNDRLFDFKSHLETGKFQFQACGKEMKGNYQPSTAKVIMTNVKTFYNCFDIEIPRIKLNFVIKDETFDDAITREMIQEALSSTSNITHKALICFMASSGLDSNTVRSLTVQDFLDACGVERIEELSEVLMDDDIIPTFYTTRGKTHYDHFTFCTPEATHYLARMVMRRDVSDTDEKLFKLSAQGVQKVFYRLNDKCGFGMTSKGTRRKFHAHGLRRFFATELSSTTINGMMIDNLIIEWFLGHKIPSVKEAYYKKKPENLKQIYLQLIPHLTFESKTVVKTVSSQEFNELKSEIDSLIEQYNNLQSQ